MAGLRYHPHPKGSVCQNMGGTGNDLLVKRATWQHATRKLRNCVAAVKRNASWQGQRRGVTLLVVVCRLKSTCHVPVPASIRRQTRNTHEALCRALGISLHSLSLCSRPFLAEAEAAAFGALHWSQALPKKGEFNRALQSRRARAIAARPARSPPLALANSAWNSWPQASWP